jgi:hypothetical protein
MCIGLGRGSGLDQLLWLSPVLDNADLSGSCSTFPGESVSLTCRMREDWDASISVGSKLILDGVSAGAFEASHLL